MTRGSERNRLRYTGLLRVVWKPKGRKSRKISITSDPALWVDIGQAKLEALVREEFCDPLRAVGSCLEMVDSTGSVILRWKW